MHDIIYKKKNMLPRVCVFLVYKTHAIYYLSYFPDQQKTIITTVPHGFVSALILSFYLAASTYFGKWQCIYII